MEESDESRKGKGKITELDGTSENFPSSRSTILSSDNRAMDFKLEPVDKPDMDFPLDGDFDKKNSFKVGMGDLDFSSQPKTSTQSKEIFSSPQKEGTNLLEKLEGESAKSQRKLDKFDLDDGNRGVKIDSVDTLEHQSSKMQLARDAVALPRLQNQPVSTLQNSKPALISSGGEITDHTQRTDKQNDVSEQMEATSAPVYSGDEDSPSSPSSSPRPSSPSSSPRPSSPSSSHRPSSPSSSPPSSPSSSSSWASSSSSLYPRSLSSTPRSSLPSTPRSSLPSTPRLPVPPPSPVSPVTLPLPDPPMPPAFVLSLKKQRRELRRERYWTAAAFVVVGGGIVCVMGYFLKQANHRVNASLSKLYDALDSAKNLMEEVKKQQVVPAATVAMAELKTTAVRGSTAADEVGNLASQGRKVVFPIAGSYVVGAIALCALAGMAAMILLLLIR